MPRKKMNARKSPYYSNLVGNATFTIGTETANVITVAVLLKTTGGDTLAIRGVVHWILFDDATGDTVTATAPDGGVAAGTNGWSLAIVAGKHGIAGTEASGTLDLAITHAAGAKTVYLGIILPDGSRVISNAIVFA